MADSLGEFAGLWSVAGPVEPVTNGTVAVREYCVAGRGAGVFLTMDGFGITCRSEFETYRLADLNPRGFSF